MRIPYHIIPHTYGLAGRRIMLKTPIKHGMGKILTLLVLDLGLDIFDSVTGLYLQANAMYR